MKPVKELFLCLLMSLQLFSVAQTRKQLLFNDNWKFNLGDASGAEKPAFNDGAWRKLTLPHDWSIEQPFSKQWASATGYLPGGIGWYRKTFDAPVNWKGKKVYIDFDGVYNNSEVWINGHYLGKRPNGFVAFSYDLTPYLNFGRENKIAVKADHSKFADSRWYTGSGIYRDVHLTIVNPVHIAKWGVAFHATPVNASLAKAAIKVNIARADAARLELLATIKDATGKIIATVRKPVPVTKDSVITSLINADIRDPKLWSVETPSLYSLQIKLLENGVEVDNWVDEVGIRSFAFDAKKGFSLNGKPMKLKGVCVHDDAGVLGVAVPEEVWLRRLDLLKQAGCNSIRMSHNPHAEYLYRLCDKMGFLVMDEAFDEWESGKNKWISGWNKGTPGKDGYHEYFAEWSVRDIEAMVLRNQNRPSIIMWSIGNEIDYPNDPYSHEVLSSGRNPQIYGKGYMPDHPPAARLGELSAVLVKAVKALDTTRPVTAALAGVVMSNTTTYPGNLDIVGYNYQEYRYDSDHIVYPARIIYGSENGMQYNNWMAVSKQDFISAQYLWTGIDYLGEAGQWPTRSNGAGLLTLGGFPKPEYYFRQSLWSDQAMLYLGTSPVSRREDNGNWSQKRAEPQWNRREGDSVSIRCFSNAEEVEVFVNGMSLGRVSKDSAHNGIYNWNTVFAPGMVEAKAYIGGKLVQTRVLKTAGKAAAIKTSVFDHALITNKDALVQMEVRITDDAGTELYRPGIPVTVKVEGAAKFIGMENSNASDTSDYHSATKPVINGPLIVYVKPDGSNGRFSITLSSPGLPSVVQEFDPLRKKK
ncbi:MAG: beta-galactosidase [Citrobacter freundii]|nr:MAG: beta-galactosidase [Citrobacter freundii]